MHQFYLQYIKRATEESIHSKKELIILFTKGAADIFNVSFIFVSLISSPVLNRIIKLITPTIMKDIHPNAGKSRRGRRVSFKFHFDVHITFNHVLNNSYRLPWGEPYNNVNYEKGERRGEDERGERI